MQRKSIQTLHKLAQHIDSVSCKGCEAWTRSEIEDESLMCPTGKTLLVAFRFEEAVEAIHRHAMQYGGRTVTPNDVLVTQ